MLENEHIIDISIDKLIKIYKNQNKALEKILDKINTSKESDIDYNSKNDEKDEIKYNIWNILQFFTYNKIKTDIYIFNFILWIKEKPKD